MTVEEYFEETSCSRRPSTSTQELEGSSLVLRVDVPTGEPAEGEAPSSSCAISLHGLNVTYIIKTQFKLISMSVFKKVPLYS